MLEQRFFPLGHPVDIAANSPAVLLAAEQSWGGRTPIFAESPLRFEIEVHSGAGAKRAAQFHATAQALHFTSGERDCATFDIERRAGRMRISAALVDNTRWFRYHYLDILVLTALDTVFFTPLHAACVARRGRGILLCGDSGAGKSTLAYACARDGWTLVSDDAAHLAAGPPGLVSGASSLLHVRETARELFSELRSIPVMTMLNGKAALEIDARHAGFAFAESAAVAHCVFLSRRPGRAALRPYPRECAVNYFLRYLPWGDRAERERRLYDLVSTGPLLLEYENVAEAVTMLGVLEEGSLEAGG